MNITMTISVHAALCKELGYPFRCAAPPCMHASYALDSHVLAMRQGFRTVLLHSSGACCASRKTHAATHLARRNPG